MSGHAVRWLRRQAQRSQRRGQPRRRRDNRSWNCGVEGPTDDQAGITLRRQQRCNFLATLLLSEGVPLVFGGDELVASLWRLRMSTQALHRSRSFTEGDIAWLRPDGGQMTSE